MWVDPCKLYEWCWLVVCYLLLLFFGFMACLLANHRLYIDPYRIIFIGGVLDIFYPEWKMQIATNETLFRMTQQLWKEAYCHEGESLDDLIANCGDGTVEGEDDISYRWHPFGAFDCSKGYMVRLF